MIMSDSTTPTEAKVKSATQKEAIQITLDSIGDGVITTDRDILVQYMNPVAAGLTGWDRDEALGR